VVLIRQSTPFFPCSLAVTGDNAIQTDAVDKAAKNESVSTSKA
jgi:hypothetical protein